MTANPMTATPGPGRRAIEVSAWPAHVARLRECVRNGDEMSEWISVEDRLPEIHEEVLVFVKRHARTGHLYGRISAKGGRPWWAVGNRHLTGVTHWMPLPEPPAPAVTEAQP
jgi:hypothetical protein